MSVYIIWPIQNHINLKKSYGQHFSERDNLWKHNTCGIGYFTHDNSGCLWSRIRKLPILWLEDKGQRLTFLCKPMCPTRILCLIHVLPIWKSNLKQQNSFSIQCESCHESYYHISFHLLGSYSARHRSNHYTYIRLINFHIKPKRCCVINKSCLISSIKLFLFYPVYTVLISADSVIPHDNAECLLS